MGFNKFTELQNQIKNGGNEMEDYTQMTLMDWMAVKEDIKRKLTETAENFVYIGCRLREIEQTESYKQDNYSDIYEFAEREYGLHRSTTQRFMAINAKFSVEGNTTQLLPEFKDFGASKLQEMLTLPDEDCRLLTAKATVKEIRELKNFNKQDPEQTEEPQQAAVVYSPFQKCIIDFFKAKEKRETLNAVLKMYFDNEQSEEIVQQQVELINPSDYAMHTKGIIYLFLYEASKGIQYKTITTNAITKMDWVDFIEEIAKIYNESYGPDTWVNFYGPVVETVEPVKEEKKEEPKQAEKPINTESSCATSHNEYEEEEEEGEETEEEDETEQSTEESVQESEDSEQNSEETSETESEPVPVYQESSEVVENPYYKLQEKAVETADHISYVVKLHKHIKIEPDMLNRIKKDMKQLAAVIEQLETMGEEM